MAGETGAVDGLGDRVALALPNLVVAANVIGCTEAMSLPRSTNLASRSLDGLGELLGDVRFAAAELVGDLLLRDLGFLDGLARRFRERGELVDLVLAIALQLAKLFELALRGVGLSLVARPRELLARPLDLRGHLPHFGVELAASLLHVGETGAVGHQLVIELAQLALQVGQDAALFGQLFFKRRSSASQAARASRLTNLIPEAQT